MLRIETTAGCRRTPMVLFLLEELELEYEIVLRPDGWFLHKDQVGPALVDGDLVIVELVTLMRHACSLARRLLPAALDDRTRVDGWLELFGATIQPAVARLSRGGSDYDRAQIERALRLLEAGLGDRPFLLGDFSLADVPAPVVLHLRSMGFPLDATPRTAAWAERVATRPAFAGARVPR
jgi:glutathione S-transferase